MQRTVEFWRTPGQYKCYNCGKDFVGIPASFRIEANRMYPYTHCVNRCAKRSMIELGKPHLCTWFTEDHGEVKAVEAPCVLVHFGGTKTLEQYHESSTSEVHPLVPLYNSQAFYVPPVRADVDDLDEDAGEGDEEGDEDAVNEDPGDGDD